MCQVLSTQGDFNVLCVFFSYNFIATEEAAPVCIYIDKHIYNSIPPKTVNYLFVRFI